MPGLVSHARRGSQRILRVACASDLEPGKEDDRLLGLLFLQPDEDSTIAECPSIHAEASDGRRASLISHHSKRSTILGFNGSSQRVRVSWSLSDFQVPPQASSNRVSFAADC